MEILMAEINTPRLMAAAKEFNIGTGTLTDFLVSKGFETGDLKPSSKISEEMYHVLQIEFQPDKVAKQKAEQIDLPKNAPADNKKRRDEQDLSFNKKEQIKVISKDKKAEEDEKAKEITHPIISEKEAEITVEEKPVLAEITKDKTKGKADETTETVPIENLEIPEVEGLKIIDKIDLSAIDSSVRPKKDTKKKVPKGKVKGVITKEESTVEEPSVEEPVKGPVAQPEKEVPVITKIKAMKLEGPKIMGKIDLPSNHETRPKPPDERRKRKRIIVEKKGGHPPNQNHPNHQNHPGGQNGQRPHPNNNNRPAPGGRFNRNAPATRREEKEIDQKEIQDKIKETQAKLAGSGGRGKSLKAKYRKQKREEASETVGDETTDNKLQL